MFSNLQCDRPPSHAVVSNGQLLHADSPTPPRRACLQDLPDDILIEIAEQLITAEHQRQRALVRLTSICTGLRALFVGTPHLWVVIVFPTQTPEWVALCVSRAKTAPLRSVVSISEEWEARFDALVAHMPKIAQLSISFFTKGPAAGEFWSQMMAATVDRIEVLKIISTTSVPLDLSIFSQSCLTSLKLMAVTVEPQSIPALPLLRQLELAILTWPAACIKQILASASLLERIMFFPVIVTGSAQDASVPAYTLPHLHYLKIMCKVENVVPLLEMVPNPDHTFRVCVECPAWSPSVTTLNQRMIACIREFTTKTMKSTPLQTSAQLVFEDQKTRHDLEISASKDTPDGPVLEYQLYCNFTERNALLDSVKTVRLYFMPDAHPNLGVLALFPGMEQLHIEEMYDSPIVTTAVSPDGNGIAHQVEYWIRTWHQRAQPLKLVTVSSTWKGTRLWFDRMAMEGIAESFVWVLKKSNNMSV